MRSVQGRAIDLAGHRTAGMLLTRVAFWQRHAKFYLDEGLAFIAKSRDAWCEDTGLSFDSYKRAIRSLEQNGLVERQRKLYGGKVRSVIRLTMKSVGLVGEAIGAEVHQPIGAELHQSTLYVEKEFKNGEGKMFSEPPSLTGDDDKDSEDSEVLNPNTKQRLLTSKATVGNMRRLWETCWREAYPGTRVDGWGSRHESQMVRFAREAEHPMRLVAEAVLSWETFSDLVRQETGDKAPAKPMSWFLARHIAVAEEWQRGYDEPKKKEDLAIKSFEAGEW